jgi:hypothetical protein
MAPVVVGTAVVVRAMIVVLVVTAAVVMVAATVTVVVVAMFTVVAVVAVVVVVVVLWVVLVKKDTSKKPADHGTGMIIPRTIGYNTLLDPAQIGPDYSTLKNAPRTFVKFDPLRPLGTTGYPGCFCKPRT